MPTIGRNGRRYDRGLRRLFQVVFCFSISICVSLCFALLSDKDGDYRKATRDGHNTGRHLLVKNAGQYSPFNSEENGYELSLAQREGEQMGNCTPRSIEQFPKDLFTEEQRNDGAIVLHIFASVYMFVGLTMICEVYFVESLEVICEVLKLQHDVAGATFMAAGSSAPELFTAIIGLFFAKSDIGIGTMVGSAVYNILVILAVCGFFAGMIVQLTWWPVLRDCTFYMISVIALVVVIFDGKIYWYEATVMLVLYIIYIVIMYFNPRLSVFFIKKVEEFKERRTRKKAEERQTAVKEDEEPLLGSVENQKETVENGSTVVSYNTFSNSVTSEITQSTARQIETTVDTACLLPNGSLKDNKKKRTEVDYESPWVFPKGALKRAFWIVMLPCTALFFFTISDCRRPGRCWRKLFFLTFTMSIFWIAVMTYFIVWMITIVGDTLGIPDTVMGLTLLAAGSSIPDTLCSLLVAREGQGDMAVSNAVGSNVCDLLFCLGLPWFIQTAIVSPASVVYMNSATLPISSIILFGTVFFFLLAVFFNRWRLDKKLGIIFSFLYVAVITISSLFEMNVFGDYNPPPCPKSPGY